MQGIDWCSTKQMILQIIRVHVEGQGRLVMGLVHLDILVEEDVLGN